MKLRGILNNLKIKKMTGSKNIEIKGITADSNKVRKGDMFIAVKGSNTDGHLYINQAITNGAVAIMLEKHNFDNTKLIPIIQINDTRAALPIIASNFYNNPSMEMTVVGITGTNGKTTISYMLEKIWREEKIETGIIGTIENRYKDNIIEANLTTPNPIELNKLMSDMVKVGVSHIVMEVSSHALDLKRVDSCNFDVAIFTNLTQDHLDYHKDFNSYFSAKKRLFTEVLAISNKKNKYSIINLDDNYGRELIKEASGKLLTYSLKNSNTDVYAKNINISDDGIKADIITKAGIIKINSGLIGKHNLYNLLAVTGAAISVGSNTETIEKVLNKIERIPGRLEKIDNDLGINVLVDYAHTPDALKNVILSLKAFSKGKLITVMGCGGDRDRKKRPLMGKIGEKYSDLLIITSDNPRTEDPEEIIKDILNGISSRDETIVSITEREKAIEYAINSANRSDTVLIAGKGHENYQIIGTEKTHFNDREISRKYLQIKESKNESK